MKQFLRDKGGNVAMIFALASVPIFGMSGMAVDTARLMNMRSTLQNEVDSAALNIAAEGPSGNFQRYVNELEDRLSDRGLSAAVVNSSWSGNDFTVSANARVNTVLVHVVPGVSREADIGARATARLHQPMEQYEPPTSSTLDPEAGDYNRIDAYCYDPDPDANKTTSERRTQFTRVEDNAGTDFGNDWPTCEPGETISFRLYNAREVRTQPTRWENGSTDVYEYYTDTRMRTNRENFDGLVHESGPNAGEPMQIVETFLCDQRSECESQSNGGIIPSGKNRTPNLESMACEPGKYMYYGWEDRPPGTVEGWEDAANWQVPGWTDSDFDDIRIVMECPEYRAGEDRYVSLVE